MHGYYSEQVEPTDSPCCHIQPHRRVTAGFIDMDRMNRLTSTFSILAHFHRNISVLKMTSGHVMEQLPSYTVQNHKDSRLYNVWTGNLMLGLITCFELELTPPLSPAGLSSHYIMHLHH